MSSHRNPSANFSSLKKLLPPLPAPNQEQQHEMEQQADLTSASNPIAASGHLSIPLNISPTDNTAAVQHQDIQVEHGSLNSLPSRSSRSVLSAKPGKSRPITRPSTFRLPVELQDALKEVAEYNQLNMTDIVAEGIWLHLQNFTWPPGSEELRIKLSHLY